jgi:hypothetical protein
VRKLGVRPLRCFSHFQKLAVTDVLTQAFLLHTTSNAKRGAVDVDSFYEFLIVG